MRIAISIPTYRPHLPHNFEFLRSVTRHRAAAPIPDVFFTTSDVGERDELLAFRATLPHEVAEKIHVDSLHDELAALGEPNFAADPDSGFAYGVIGFITYKKFLGLRRAFDRGFDHVVILDSEVIQFRKADLTRALINAVERDECRASVTAYREPWATKVQHDSLRTIVASYDTTAVFARAYGWYDCLCAFEKTEFDAFIRFLAGDAGAGGGAAEILRATHRFRGFAFDWIVYQVWRQYVAGRDLNWIDLDARLADVGVKPKPKPQTENMFLYFGEDQTRNAALVRALDPPWVPFTRNVDYLAAITAGAPDTCCLMFHADRSHPGAAALPNVRQRFTRWLTPYLRRAAKRLLAVDDGR